MQLAAFADEADSSLAGQISAMKENGVSYLEIRGVDGENISDLTLTKAREIRKRLEDEGLRVWSLGSPMGKIGIEEEFGPHLDKFCHTLELAHELACSHMRMFSFFLPQGADPAVYRDQVMERLSRFLEKAKGSGVILCHENEKGIYGDKADRCLEIHQSFPELRGVFDPANFIQCGQDTKEAWEMLAPYIEYFHVKDALADGSVVPAGKGVGQLPFLLEEYRKQGGEILSVEPHLTVFEGFAQLEREGKTPHLAQYQYPSGQAAFGAAVSALKELLG